MKILIYGAGNNGKIVMELLKNKYRIDDDVAGYIDQNKDGNYQGYPIYKLEDVTDQMILESKIVIAIADFNVVREVCLMLKEKKYTHIYWFGSERSVFQYQDFFEEQCIDCRCWSGSLLQQVEMHIIDACNLNCRGCTHYSPIFSAELPDLQKRLMDVKKLKEKFSHIVKFYILGGEPLLNPELKRYIEEIRDILPNTEMYIVTNGLLIPQMKENILECIKRNHIIVTISEYEPTHKILDKILDRLNEINIIYEIRSIAQKATFNLPFSLSEKSIYPNTCISDGCVTIWNGKIARCPQLMYLPYFNQYFATHLPEIGIIDLKEDCRGEELLKRLDEKVPLCRYCIQKEIRWSICGKNAKLEDFVVFN